MSDVDFLLFDDYPDEDSGPAINVLAVGVPAATSEALSIRAAMCRDPDYRDASRVIFEEEDEREKFSNAKEFMRAMRWPRLPSIAEAGAWLLSKRAAVDERTAARVAAAGDR